MRHHAALAARGVNAPVIYAKDVRRDTSAAVGALWRAIGLPPADRAFSWQNEQPGDWKQVGEWHGTASASTGIAPITDAEIADKKGKFAALVHQCPHVQDYLDHHIPHCEMLQARALKV